MLKTSGQYTDMQSSFELNHDVLNNELCRRSLRTFLLLMCSINSLSMENILK
jgi:hypothetical protein